MRIFYMINMKKVIYHFINKVYLSKFHEYKLKIENIMYIVFLLYL